MEGMSEFCNTRKQNGFSSLESLRIREVCFICQHMRKVGGWEIGENDGEGCNVRDKENVKEKKAMRIYSLILACKSFTRQRVKRYPCPSWTPLAPSRKVKGHRVGSFCS